MTGVVVEQQAMTGAALATATVSLAVMQWLLSPGPAAAQLVTFAPMEVLQEAAAIVPGQQDRGLHSLASPPVLPVGRFRSCTCNDDR
jgi:hypothetical protein